MVLYEDNSKEIHLTTSFQKRPNFFFLSDLAPPKMTGFDEEIRLDASLAQSEALTEYGSLFISKARPHSSHNHI